MYRLFALLAADILFFSTHRASHEAFLRPSADEGPSGGAAVGRENTRVLLVVSPKWNQIFITKTFSQVEQLSKSLIEISRLANEK